MRRARAVTIRNVAAMRADPDGRSDQVSQALFGEVCTVHETNEDWLRIETPDCYMGWVESKNLAILETDETYPQPQRAAMIAPLFQSVFRDAAL